MGSEVRSGVPPSLAGRVLSRADSYPEHGYGRFNSQSGESKNSSVRVQHTRHATFAVLRCPSARATRPAEAG